MESKLREVYKIIKSDPVRALELSEELYSESQDERQNLYERIQRMYCIIKTYHESFISNKVIKYEDEINELNEESSKL